MLTYAVVMTALVLAPAQQDTVVAVERGVRLELESHRGEVVIRSWDRDAVQVQTSGRRAERPEVSRSGAVLRVRPLRERPPTGSIEVTVTVPRWMPVRVNGHQLGVRVAGTEADVTVETVGGDVVVEGGAGRVSVNTVQGRVTVRGARGRVDVWTVNESIQLDGIDGEVSAETTNGAITMRGIRSSNARAATVNGSVTFDGSIRDNGRYAFTTHNGAITVTVPERANATVSAAAYHGSFESDFPVRLTGTSRDRHYNFTLGSGTARVELESFNGNIRLRRPR